MAIHASTGRVCSILSHAFATRACFTRVDSVPSRPNRSELYVPGSRSNLFAKAINSAADVIVLDLEDSVAPAKKPSARQNVVSALKELDFGHKVVAVRINGCDTEHQYRDILDIIEQSGERLDMLVLPMIGNAADVYAVDALTSQVERAVGREKRLGFALIIETALGMSNVHAIAGASRRTESLHFGVGDYITSVGASVEHVGGSSSNYGVLTEKDADGKRYYHWGDVWHYPISRMVCAARANGLRAIDGPFATFNDLDGYQAQCNRAVALGCDGKWAIHPSQVKFANDIFS